MTANNTAGFSTAKPNFFIVVFLSNAYLFQNNPGVGLIVRSKPPRVYCDTFISLLKPTVDELEVVYYLSTLFAGIFHDPVFLEELHDPPPGEADDLSRYSSGWMRLFCKENEDYIAYLEAR